ncbi:MAG: dual specificity protein phosphatase family protein [Alphaproteobacteria bacterium]|nr:dual specificity protein phosphatase family protein [Alphaproteobacteria bacterium]
MRRLISFAGQSLGVFLLFFTLASAQTASLTAEQRTEKKTQLPFGNLKNTPYFGNVVYAAQPDADTVKMLKSEGFDLVINIRELNEDLGFDEKGLIEGQGITYMQIPYLTAPTFEAEFSDEALSKIKSVIDEATNKGQKILLHCSHGQRAGSSLGMILYRDYGYSKEEALAAATAAGMNSEWAVPRFHRYIDQSVQVIKPFGGIHNIVKYKNFYITSQPPAEAFAMMKERGITTVITNRAAIENNGFEEEKYAEEAGLKFYRARIYNDQYGDIKDGKLNVAELEKALGIIASTTDGDVLVHCGSGDRASMVLAAHLYSVDKEKPEEALSKARIAGLKHPGITEQLEKYMDLK